MAPTLSVDATPSKYGTTETLKCTDASYIYGNSYIWKKDGDIIFTNAGKESTTGKYSESIDGTTFKLIINDIVVSDEGSYTASHAFEYSNKLNLEVESQGTVTAKLTSDNLLEVTFHQIYPKTILAVITCDNQLTSGSFLSPVEDGDRFTIIWQSSETFCTVPKTCSAVVTLRTTFTTDFTVTPDDSLSAGKIAGIVIGSVGGAVLLVCGAIRAYFKQTSRPRAKIFGNNETSQNAVGTGSNPKNAGTKLLEKSPGKAEDVNKEKPVSVKQNQHADQAHKVENEGKKPGRPQPLPPVGANPSSQLPNRHSPGHDKKGRGLSANFGDDDHPLVGVDIPAQKAGTLPTLEDTPREDKKKTKKKKKKSEPEDKKEDSKKTETAIDF